MIQRESRLAAHRTPFLIVSGAMRLFFVAWTSSPGYDSSQGKPCDYNMSGVFASRIMVTTRRQALEIAAAARAGLEKLYGERLRGVYLYGSAARDQLTPDIDIAVILDKIDTTFDEHKRVSQLGADLSLDHDTVVLFFFATEADSQRGRFAIHRYIKEEGVGV